MSKAVMCIVQTLAQAEDIIDDLKSIGFEKSDISVLFPSKDGTHDFAHEHHTKAPEGAIAGVGAGGVVGGAIGLLAGIGVLAIPGLGAFIAAGPLLAAMSGAAAGATVGGMAGALIGLGVPEIEARRYEGKIRGGNILISVHTKTNDALKGAKKIFTDAKAGDICSTIESAVPRSHEAVRPQF